ncbi:methyltransferase domain-containing protein [Streptomyces hydrogenans]|uniref:methyltransferase domain-containing protein n=1 Tax=Streptomyces hydrogenans TaxID=1873719 RepID=UPI0035DB1A77
MRERREVWTAGEEYERYMGRWSRLVAEEFVGWLGEGDGGGYRLDAGCGTGALTAAAAAHGRARAVVGVDRSAGFVAAARGAVPAAAGFVVADAGALPVRDGALDAVVSGLALNFLPLPDAAVAGWARAVRPGGLVAAYVWDYAGGMGFLRCFWDAAVAVDPSAAALDEGGRFPLCRPEPLRALWSGAELVDVVVAPIEVPTVFSGFPDLWEPFLSGQGPAPGYVAALDADTRVQLREALRAALPVRPDGSITLTARAWAVRGRRPEGGTDPAGPRRAHRPDDPRRRRTTVL